MKKDARVEALLIVEIFEVRGVPFGLAISEVERVSLARDAEVRAETIEECEMATGMDLRLLLHARSLAAKSKP